MSVSFFRDCSVVILDAGGERIACFGAIVKSVGFAHLLRSGFSAAFHCAGNLTHAFGDICVAIAA